MEIFGGEGSPKYYFLFVYFWSTNLVVPKTSQNTYTVEKAMVGILMF